ncbi:MAG: DUF975 family protein [Eubacteriales bacterium]
MNQYATAAELKSLARTQLVGNYGVFIKSLFTFQASSILISIIQSLSTPTTNSSIIAIILYFLISLICTLIPLLFIPGIAKLSLHIATKQPTSYQLLFYGFSNQPKKTVLLTLFKYLISFLFLSVPIISVFYIINFGRAFYLYYEYRDDRFYQIILFCIVSLFLLQIIIAIINFFILFKLGFLFFLLADIPNCTAWQIIKLNLSLTKGHCKRLFQLHISFLGWYLLCILSCGIGFLWLIPCYNVTLANFYLDLLRQRSTPSVEPSV